MRVKTAVAKAQSKLADRGRVNLRSSGTEPLLRIMVEGPEKELIEEIANEIARVIKRVSRLEH